MDRQIVRMRFFILGAERWRGPSGKTLVLAHIFEWPSSGTGKSWGEELEASGDHTLEE